MDGISSENRFESNTPSTTLSGDVAVWASFVVRGHYCNGRDCPSFVIWNVEESVDSDVSGVEPGLMLSATSSSVIVEDISVSTNTAVKPRALWENPY